MNGEKERQLLILLVSGIVIVVIVSILLLVRVWTHSPEEEPAYTYEVGTIDTTTSVTSDDYVKQYYAKLERILLYEDYKSLYNLLGEDYIQHADMTEEKLKDYLLNKQITGKLLTLKSYEKINSKDFNNVYIMDLKIADGIYDLNIVVREKSPNDFSIALDNYIVSKPMNYNTTSDGVNLSIDKITYYSDYVEYDLAIKNVHNDSIILNHYNFAECIYLRLADDTLTKPYATVMGGRSIKIERERVEKYKVIYGIQNNKTSQIRSIVITDVYYSGRDLTSDVEFAL